MKGYHITFLCRECGGRKEVNRKKLSAEIRMCKPQNFKIVKIIFSRSNCFCRGNSITNGSKTFANSKCIPFLSSRISRKCYCRLAQSTGSHLEISRVKARDRHGQAVKWLKEMKLGKKRSADRKRECFPINTHGSTSQNL